MSGRKLRRGLWFSARTKTWHFEFNAKGPDGQPIKPRPKGDTGCPSFPMAEAWLRAKKTRMALEKVGITEEPLQAKPTLAEAHRAWRRDTAGRLSASWRETVDRAMRLHFAEIGKLPLDALTNRVVQDALNAYLLLPGRTAGGSNVILRALNAVVGHALGPDAVRPFRIKQTKVQQTPRAPLAPEDLGTLIRKLQEMGASHQVVDLCRLMAGTGVRISEARRARVEAINTKTWTFTPWDPEVGTKGKEAVELPVPRWLRPHLERMIAGRTEGYLIPGSRTAFPSQTLVWKWLAQAREKLGWPWLTPHELRGAYATFLLDHGVSLKSVQALLRHKSSKTTERYVRATYSKVHAALDEIGEAAGL